MAYTPPILFLETHPKKSKTFQVMAMEMTSAALTIADTNVTQMSQDYKWSKTIRLS